MSRRIGGRLERALVVSDAGQRWRKQHAHGVMPCVGCWVILDHALSSRSAERSIKTKIWCPHTTHHMAYEPKMSSKSQPPVPLAQPE